MNAREVGTRVLMSVDSRTGSKRRMLAGRGMPACRGTRTRRWVGPLRRPVRARRRVAARGLMSAQRRKFGWVSLAASHRVVPGCSWVKSTATLDGVVVGSYRLSIAGGLSRMRSSLRLPLRRQTVSAAAGCASATPDARVKRPSRR